MITVIGLVLVGAVAPEFGVDFVEVTTRVEQLFVGRLVSVNQDGACIVVFRPEQAIKGPLPTVDVTVRDCGRPGLTDTREPPPSWQVGDRQLVGGAGGVYRTLRNLFWQHRYEAVSVAEAAQLAQETLSCVSGSNQSAAHTNCVAGFLRSTKAIRLSIGVGFLARGTARFDPSLLADALVHALRNDMSLNSADRQSLRQTATRFIEVGTGIPRQVLATLQEQLAAKRDDHQ